MRDAPPAVRIGTLSVSLPAGLGSAEAHAWAHALAEALARRLPVGTTGAATVPLLRMRASRADAVADELAREIVRQLHGGAR